MSIQDQGLLRVGRLGLNEHPRIPLLPLRSTWVEDCQVVYSLHGFLSPAPIPRRVRAGPQNASAQLQNHFKQVMGVRRHGQSVGGCGDIGDINVVTRKSQLSISWLHGSEVQGGGASTGRMAADIARQHADRYDRLEPSERPIRGECARSTVRGRFAPVSRLVPRSIESLRGFNRRAIDALGGA